VVEDDPATLRQAVFDLGYAHPDDPEQMQRNAIEIIELVCEPFAHRGSYDFAASSLVARARDRGLKAAFGHGLRSPPPETMFLHRKLVGTFMICAKLHAHINVHALIKRFL